uniref:Uncharacterized protein n=1 Tax=Meloidogyne hapla TaxID=6305 RepID=A0A1I8C1G4_MELHA
MDQTQMLLFNCLGQRIETSKDLSKMVDNISFDFINWPNFGLSERAENIEKQNNYVIFTKYQLSNIYNPKMRFFIYNKQRNDGSIRKVTIYRIIK